MYHGVTTRYFGGLRSDDLKGRERLFGAQAAFSAVRIVTANSTNFDVKLPVDMMLRSEDSVDMLLSNS